jgi:FeS assembly SUF system protein
MADQAGIEREVIAALRTCHDPEIPVDIYELGLIYGVTVAPEGVVHVRMTLTSPNCPAAQELPAEVEAKVRAVPGVTAAGVEVVFDPPWCSDMMSEAARLELGMM